MLEYKALLVVWCTFGGSSLRIIPYAISCWGIRPDAKFSGCINPLFVVDGARSDMQEVLHPLGYNTMPWGAQALTHPSSSTSDDAGGDSRNSLHDW